MLLFSDLYAKYKPGRDVSLIGRIGQRMFSVPVIGALVATLKVLTFKQAILLYGLLLVPLIDVLLEVECNTQQPHTVPSGGQ